jgi:hypothetical protein
MTPFDADCAWRNTAAQISELLWYRRNPANIANPIPQRKKTFGSGVCKAYAPGMGTIFASTMSNVVTDSLAVKFPPHSVQPNEKLAEIAGSSTTSPKVKGIHPLEKLSVREMAQKSLL